MTSDIAPGQPGIPPRWTSSAKSGVGTSTTASSRVWFTLSHGIVNEVYYPGADQANTRDLGFLVADGRGFFSEEKRDASHEIRPIEQGVPAYNLTNTCQQGRYRIHKTILTDPHRNVLLQRIRFQPLQGRLADYGLYVLLAPHIANQGADSSGWTGKSGGMDMLFAQRNHTALAMACSAPFSATSCGYVGVSDGWRDVRAHGKMAWQYARADDGNIALTAQIDLEACAGQFTLALGFGATAADAAQQARASLLVPFDRLVADYVAGWQEFQDACVDLGVTDPKGFDIYRVSTAVLKTHEAKRGAILASLSIPWGASKGDADLGGYHLVWPRDLVEAAGGLLAAGDAEHARQTLLYLMSTQQADGHWPQNMWLDGTPYWDGIQMDETALPILLADALRRSRELNGLDPWPMVRAAAAYLVRNGPVTQQDRWEEDGGYSPFTLAVEIAALLAAADFAEQAGQVDGATYLRQTADAWNASIERWCYVTDTPLSRQHRVAGYYVRIAPPEMSEAASPAGGFVAIKNRPPDQSCVPATALTSPDALALVRFGLRRADDPRILDTIKVIDAVLKTETPTGPVWHRYPFDGYGEKVDGSPFDGTGIGRGWPLFAGERGHYELARGRSDEAMRLLGVLAAQSSSGGLIPEQVWDAPDIPSRELFTGHPSGSAMPLVWAHAEYIKLARSLHDDRIFDLPPQTHNRYVQQQTPSPYTIWRFNQKTRGLIAGSLLRLETLSPAVVHFSTDGWTTASDLATRQTTLGIHLADLPTGNLAVGGRVMFTFYWPQANRWEGCDFGVAVTQPQHNED